MKKFTAFLLIWAVLLSLMPVASHAATVTNNVLIDFDDYISGVSTEYKDYLSCSSDSYSTAYVDSSATKAIKLYNVTGANTYVNFNAESAKNIVYGFSCYLNDAKTEFYAVHQKPTPKTVLVKMYGSNVKLGSETSAASSAETGKWYDFAIAMDYTNHEAYVYRDRILLGTVPLDEAIEKTTQVQFYFPKNKYASDGVSPASAYLNNVFAQYPPASVTANPSGDMVDSRTTREISISFGQNVLYSESASVTLNGESTDFDFVIQNGYLTGVKLKNLSLSGDTDYLVAFTGIKDFFGNSIPSHSFKTASTAPALSISCENAGGYHVQGTKLTFNITSANLEGNGIEIYNNDKCIETLPTGTTQYTLVLEGGTNNIYAKVPALGTESNHISVSAEAYDVIRDVKHFDFDKNLGMSDLYVAEAAGGTMDVRKLDNAHGNSLYMKLTRTSEKESIPYMRAETATGKYGIYVYEAEFNFSQVETGSNNFFVVKTNDDQNVVLYKMENGVIKLNVDDKRVIYNGLKANEWVKLKAWWDIENKTGAFFVNDELVARDVPMPITNFDSIKYVTHAINHKEEATTSMYMDNIKTYFLAKRYNVDASFDSAASNEVPYENAVVTLNFDQKMNPDTLKNVILTDESGKAVPVSFVTSDNLEFTLSIDSLSPDTSYTIDLSGVSTKLGAVGNTSVVNFKTKKLPFAIANASVTELGVSVKVNVDIQNLGAESRTYIVIAALYDGNKMLCSGTQAFSSASSENSIFTLDKPDESYIAEIYIFDSADTLNLIDKYIVD